MTKYRIFIHAETQDENGHWMVVGDETKHYSVVSTNLSIEDVLSDCENWVDEYLDSLDVEESE